MRPAGRWWALLTGSAVFSEMLAIGLISGTSADGIDAAVVRIGEPAAGALRVETLAWSTYAYPPAIRASVLRVAAGAPTTAGEICRLHVAIGERFADAALAVCGSAGIDSASVAVIGSHGQTVWHEPNPTGDGPLDVASTLQLGQGQVIAERTGIPTVFDFRPRDVAAGGQGAPLVPMVDQLLFADPTEGRILLNIGGIANVTVLPADGAAAPAFGYDTGPGNMLLDGAVALLTHGRLAYDRDGEMAGQGEEDPRLLGHLLAEPYYRLPPPKSTGRELFGPSYLAHCLALAEQLEISPPSVVATLTALTAVTITDSIASAVLPRGGFRKVIASGGGVHNPYLMRRLAEGLAPLGLDLTTSGAYGVDPDAKEAVAFAVLAWLSLHGRAGNLPAATGAARPVVLGVLAPGRAR
jgi:anhydro-N-acetylmuramic acid kinase